MRLAMIRKLKMMNFKSLRALSLELSDRNVFLGPNASGKSNILDALRLLRDVVTMANVDKAVEKNGGAGTLRSKTVIGTRDMQFRIVIDLSKSKKGYPTNGGQWSPISAEYRIKFKCYVSQPRRIIRETLWYRGRRRQNRQWEAEHRYLVFDRHQNHVKVDKLTRTPRGVVLGENRISLPPEMSVIPFVSSTGRLLGWETITFCKYVEGMRFYSINAAATRRPSPAENVDELDPDGSNLGAILLELGKKRKPSQADSSLVSGLVDFMVASVPEFKDFGAERSVEGGLAVFKIKESKEVWFYPKSISDGTLRVLAFFLALMYRKVPATVLGFEEPENSVHPFVVNSMMSLVKNYPFDTQFFLTTHSKFVADAFGPRNVFLVSKDEGDTKIARADSDEEILRFCKRYGIGEAWVRGLIGAVP
jgi:predicted ATPase